MQYRQVMMGQKDQVCSLHMLDQALVLIFDTGFLKVLDGGPIIVTSAQLWSFNF